ncbi:hypothetical protein OVA11_19265 [Caulobacter sp. SL161]|nr:hypothetical protein [Caulobacter sp. SL161]MCY1649119.1 hypothetical protein [Caulobacter sp. SL161]
MAALVPDRAALQPGAARDDVVLTAGPALEQPGEDAGLGLIGQGAGLGLRCDGQSLLRGRPCCVVDDPELRNRRSLPLALGLDRLDALAGVGVFALVEPVPDLDADIQLAPQDAVPALARSAEGRGVPEASRRAGRALLVEVVGDVAAAPALVVEPERRSHDRGLILDNRHLAAGRGAVAIDAAAHRKALLAIRVHAALGLVREVLKVQLGHQAFDRDVHQLEAILGQGRDADAEIGQAFEGGRVLGEVPEQPVLMLDQDQVEGAGLGRAQQGLSARPRDQQIGRDRRVGVFVDDRPAARARMATAERELVSDRAGVLLVVGIASVDRDAHS